MKQNIKKPVTALILSTTLFVSPVSETFAYIPTARDTLVAPQKAVYEEEQTDDFTLLYETGTCKYFWREDRDVIAVLDKSTGYVMKTGADLPFGNDIKDAVKKLKKKDGVTAEEILAAAESYAADLNTTYVGIANSLITVEYFDSDKIKYISSASAEGAASKLVKLNNNEYRLETVFTSIDININVYVTFGESDINYRIPKEEISGNGAHSLAAIDITPFLGASGGVMNVLNPETLDWEKVEAYRTPGYVLVPDGSGALIRFGHNTSVFNPYVGDVYGKDYATETYYYNTLYEAVPAKDPVMPVFGIAHGNGQMAFVAWADKGDEYMEIIVNHDGSKGASYTWGYPRFEYNVNYYQIFDEKGAGYFTQMKKPFDIDIDMTYSFLFGDGSDGSYPADYAGMALRYREHLLENGTLTEIRTNNDEIPIRIDFIMGDSEKGLFGTKQIVTTTTKQVKEILDDIQSNGVKNINSGLIGWQSKGETLTAPYKMSFTGKIGTKGDFEKLIEQTAAQGIDVSLSRNMISVNRKMLNYYNNAVKSISNWYISEDRSWLLPENSIITGFSYATPVRAAEWLKKLSDKTSKFSTSLTVSGMTNVLTSNWNRDGAETTLTEAIELYESAFESVNEKSLLNLENPNMYLWKYTDRYLNAPVGGSQYIFENDSVPFLQMVLHGTMEMYAPYSNFSFYTKDCVLRMIDYNLSPSFIISGEPSYLLSDSFSFDLYSTEYSLYEDMIANIYNQVNDILKYVNGYEWTDRFVPEDGVVINTYKSGNVIKYVVINYTEGSVYYKGLNVPAQSACVSR